IHLEDHFKWTALHHAAHSGQLGVVRTLIDAGAQINHESLTLATPLSRAIESSALDVVDYLIQKGANVRHENLTQRNLLDLATDFATPQVVNVIRTAYERKGNKKGTQQSKSRRRTTTNIKKKKSSETPSVSIKPVKLEPLLPRRGSLLLAEKHLMSSNDIFGESIAYHPLTIWTDQPTTDELLDKKINLRNQFTMNIDFPN
ncbi:unnamed protein product, partial [Adineta steineri]